MYLVFLGDVYYPSHGLGDLIGEAENIDQAKQMIKSKATEEWSEAIEGGYLRTKYNTEQDYFEDIVQMWAAVYKSNTFEEVLFIYSEDFKNKLN